MKWLYRDVDAPALDYGTEKGLDRLCKDFAFGWSKFVMDHDTLRPVKDRRGAPILRKWPHWCLYVWNRDENKYHLVVEAMLPPGPQAVKALEKDLWMNTNRSIDRKVSEAKMIEQAAVEAAANSFKDDQRHWIAENKKRFHDHVFEGKHSSRDAKISSYGGQVNRSTPTGKIMKELKEDGFTEKPKRS